MKKYKIFQFLIIFYLLFIWSLGFAQTKSTSNIVDITFGENGSTSDLKVTDLNNDGADELIVLSRSNYNYINAFRWNENYFQQIWETHLIYTDYLYGMQVSDFDSDGKKDLLVSIYGWGCSKYLLFYKNYGDIFVDQGFLTETNPDETFCAHDLDGDSLVDLATGSIYANSGFSIQLYKHDSTNQSVQYMGVLPNATNGSNLVKALNINNDDKMDILGVEKYSGTLYTYLNEDGFDFTQTYTHQFSDRVFSIETADFNNDTLEDFVAGEYNSKLHFFKNEGDGDFNLIFSGSVEINWNDMEKTDINHDGKVDLVAQSYDGHVYLYKNLGDFTFEEMILTESDTISYNMALGDFDGNGEVDLAYGRNPIHIVFDALNLFIPLSVHEQQIINDNGLSISQNSPNPFKNATTINFELKHSKTGELIVFDQNGKSVFNAAVYSTEEAIKISGDQLKPGIYFYQLKTDDGESETKKMIKLN